MEMSLSVPMLYTWPGSPWWRMVSKAAARSEAKMKFLMASPLP